MKNKTRLPRPVQHAGHVLTYLVVKDLWIVSKGENTPHLRTALTLAHARRLAEQERERAA